MTMGSKTEGTAALLSPVSLAVVPAAPAVEKCCHVEGS
jgi:hypothetical protein